MHQIVEIAAYLVTGAGGHPTALLVLNLRQVAQVSENSGHQ